MPTFSQVRRSSTPAACRLANIGYDRLEWPALAALETSFKTRVVLSWGITRRRRPSLVCSRPCRSATAAPRGSRRCGAGLEWCQPAAHALNQLRVGDGGTGHHGHHRADRLSEAWVGYPEHQRILYRRVRLQRFFDLFGEDFSPPELMHWLPRPSRWIVPSASTVAWSPVITCRSPLIIT